MKTDEAIADPSHSAANVLVTGLVQGVGFRPFVYRIAVECALAGSVRNVPGGVRIEVEGTAENLARFRQGLTSRAPTGSAIDRIEWKAVGACGRSAFAIEHCAQDGPISARLPADRSICPACREEIDDPLNRRFDYPFTSCTACGPRYSILSAMPYHRSATTMRNFRLCAACEDEYRDPMDRRFHAEPNACSICGPRATLLDDAGRTIADPERAIEATVELLRQGRIVALKGLGGYQLLTPADDDAAIVRLRQSKNRRRKPFAVMVLDIETAERLGHLEKVERQLLGCPQNPIVLVRRKGAGLSDSIAPGLDTVGLFLPTTPLHHLILKRFGRPIVATSGNRSQEPIIIDDSEPPQSFRGLADAILVHDRPIVRRLDDSVVRVIDDEPVFLRLARGYAPLALPEIEEIARRHSLPPILATGGHFKCAQAVWTGTQALLAQHVGDLDSRESRESLIGMERDLADLYRFQPSIIACDAHPDYFTSRRARERGLPVVEVQHHHAHAAACLAEYNLMEREVFALAWDGTGFGKDGTIWGGEVLRATATEFERISSLLPFALPGGERAIREPNRIAFALLWQAARRELSGDSLWLRKLNFSRLQADGLATMIERKINSPWTTSLGRLFDGVAALVLGINEATYEGEAAIALEAIADPAIKVGYPFPSIDSPDEVSRGDWRPLLRLILKDLEHAVAVGIIAARFHNAVAAWATTVAGREPAKDIILCGGCFQNRFLAERVLGSLRHLDRKVYLNHRLPAGDGGLAAGQLAVAVARLAADRQRISSDR